MKISSQENNKITILVLGIGGMLGHTLFNYFSANDKYNVFGTIRDKNINELFAKYYQKIIKNVNALIPNNVKKCIDIIEPDIVINCIGIIKQLEMSKNNLVSITLNAQFPHILYEICSERNIRLLHFSTDCIFSGHKGNYIESDRTDVSDIYGLTKYLGEVNRPNCMTIRTSIIGHELRNKKSLIEWFLAQKNEIKGYTQAIYSGLPTIEMAKVIEKYILPIPNLSGLYHVSTNPISKYELLTLVKDEYKKSIKIIPDKEFKCDRSLNSDKFKAETGYNPPTWPELIKKMHANFSKSNM